MTTINPAFSFGQTQGDLGFSYVFAAQEIMETLKDELDVLGLGVVPLQGDLVGSGSDTVRITNLGNVGWDVVMDALATETSAINPKTVTTGYSTAAIALYGLGHSETYKQQTLSREVAISVDQLKTKVPQSWLATFRSLVATAGAGFGTAVGSASAAQSVDDWIDLATVYREQLGSAKRGPPIVFLDPAQVTQSVASARNEPAFQNSINEFTAIQGLDQRQVIDNFLGLGFRVALSDDINQAAGAYQGFSFSVGGIGWVVASTSRIVPAQVTQSVASARNEPAFQNSINEFTAIQGLDQRQVIDNFLGLGFRVALSDDINQAAGAYQGFSFSVGGIGWVVASTSRIVPANPQGAMVIPEFGIIIEEVAGAGQQGKRAYEARTFFGVAAGSGDVHVQRRMISLV